MPQMSDEEARAMQHYLVKKRQTDPPKTANDRQVGGDHYKTEKGEQHWDMMWRLYREAWFVGAVTKYVLRYRKKDGIKDLEKARHYLDKLIELEKAEEKETIEDLKARVPFHYQEREEEEAKAKEEEVHSTPETRQIVTDGSDSYPWERLSPPPVCYFCNQLASELVETVQGPMCKGCYSSKVSAGAFKNYESGKE